MRAYELYLDRKGVPGSALNDWIQAEVDHKPWGNRKLALSSVLAVPLYFNQAKQV